MKRILVVVFLLCISVSFVFGQWSGYYGKGDGELDGGVGMTWIDDESYFNISFQPDISIGNLGIGLQINLLYNTETGAIRKEDWDEDYDYARLIRYLRWGHKGDKVYARLGALDNTVLGHGFIVNYYNNQIYYDQRKIGLIFDLDLGRFGFESLTSNLARKELMGVRGYYRPLYTSEIPVLKNFAFGASYAGDLDPDSTTSTDDGISFWGVDVELPLIKRDALSLLLYADHASVISPVTEYDMAKELYQSTLGSSPADSIMTSWDTEESGSGQAVGIKLDLHALLDLVNVTIQFERRFLNKGYIPGYFGPFYEVNRYTSVGQLAEFYEGLGADVSAFTEFETLYGVSVDQIHAAQVQQKMLLPLITGSRQGWFGGLYADFLKIIQVMGTYQQIDGVGNTGLLHLGAGLSQEIPVVALEASYDKAGIDQLKDIFTLDRRSVARVGVGYKIKPYLLLYMDYIWTFWWDEEAGAFRPQERIQPRLAFRYPLNL